MAVMNAFFTDSLRFRQTTRNIAKNTFWSPPEASDVRSLAGGKGSGRGRPEQNWLDCLADDLEEFGNTVDSAEDDPRTFGVDRSSERRGWMGYRRTRGGTRRPADWGRPNGTGKNTAHQRRPPNRGGGAGDGYRGLQEWDGWDQTAWYAPDLECTLW